MEDRQWDKAAEVSSIIGSALGMPKTANEAISSEVDKGVLSCEALPEIFVEASKASHCCVFDGEATLVPSCRHVSIMYIMHPPSHEIRQMAYTFIQFSHNFLFLNVAKRQS